MSDIISFTDEQFKAFMERFKHTPASTTLDGAQLHGPLQGGSNYGPFADPGVNTGVYSAMPRVESLVQALGSPLPSEYANELLDIMTGITDASGTNATGWCENPPTVLGLLKKCKQSIPFGKYYGKFDLQAIPEIGKLRNRADVPRQILNNGAKMNPYIPDMMWRLDDTRSQLQYDLFRFGQAFSLTSERVFIQGNNATASTATQLGWWSEFNGLDQQIKTGYTNVDTGVACPAADSYVVSWNADINATVNGRLMQDVLNDMLYALQERASRVGMNGFTLVCVIRKELFRRLVDVIACTYANTLCKNNFQTTDNFNDQINTNDNDTVARRDAMLNGRYLLMLGQQIPVVFSDGIELNRTIAATGGDTLNSDIYFGPIEWMGEPLTYFEYFPMDNPYASEYMSFVNADGRTVLNNGLWLVGSAEKPMCTEFHWALQGRLILRTPFLAGRIDGVSFTYDTNMTRSPYADETYLYKDGGATYTT
jgi:hypothetical protein